LEGLMQKLKLQYFGHLMPRVDSFEKTLMLGGIGGRRRRGWQRMRWLDGHHWFNGSEFEWTLGVGDGRPGVLWFMGSQRVGHNWVTELNWYSAVREALKGIQKRSIVNKKEKNGHCVATSGFCHTIFCPYNPCCHVWLLAKYFCTPMVVSI